MLETAILTICDPRGNWNYGWKLICDMAEIDPKFHPAPFKDRSIEGMLRPGEQEPPA